MIIFLGQDPFDALNLSTNPIQFAMFEDQPLPVE